MLIRLPPSLCLALLLALGASCGSTDGVRVSLPAGAPGIGFDDLRYSPALGKVLVPAGRAGELDLIDPEALTVARIGGFSAKASYQGGHDDGPTSVDEGRGLLFVTDRSAQQLAVVDAGRAAVVARVPLAASPDYVRFVAATGELWVTEPDAEQIEIFALPQTPAPTPQAVATIAVSNGPESLVIDPKSGRAFTHRWQRSTVVLDVRTHAVLAEWSNGCASSRGIAFDSERGFLFVACSEGTVSVLDAVHDGRVLGSLARGAGFDVIGYDARLGHLYLAGSACRCLVIEGVSSSGELSFLGRYNAPAGSHCAVGDEHGHVFTCDPEHGSLFRVADPFPPATR
jgi:DNA-binding beta-propeller fold protein YncE